MLDIRRTSKFKKDVKRMEKRGKNFDEFKEVIMSIATNKTLPEKYRDHSLRGNYQGARECHIEPDWLLVYELQSNELILVRTGSHSDLFN